MVEFRLAIAQSDFDDRRTADDSGRFDHDARLVSNSSKKTLALVLAGEHDMIDFRLAIEQAPCSRSTGAHEPIVNTRSYWRNSSVTNDEIRRHATVQQR